MINFTKALSVFATMLAFTNADPIREPARLRLNADLIKTVFHSGDQRILDIFSDLEWEEPDGLLQNFIGSITTVDGIDPENYDFEIFLNDPEKKFIGFEGKNLRFVGKAKYDGVEYSFQAPVKEFRLEMEMIHDPDKEIAKINKDAMMPTAKQFSFDLDDVAVEGGADEALRQLFKDESEKAVLTAYEDIWEGDFETMSKLPLESFLPMLLLKQISSVAKTFEIAPNYLEYGFDPEIFYAKDRPFFKKKRSMLKEIDSEFTEQKEGDDPFAFQIILDENVVNAFLLDFVLYEKAFSLR